MLNVTTDQLEHETATHTFKPAYALSKEEEKHHSESRNIKTSLLYGYQSFKDRIAQIKPFTENTFATISRLFKGLGEVEKD